MLYNTIQQTVLVTAMPTQSDPRSIIERGQDGRWELTAFEKRVSTTDPSETQTRLKHRQRLLKHGITYL